MLTMLHGTRGELRVDVEKELAAYRYEVFVEALGWDLPCDRGFERDRFDRDDTVYVIARDDGGAICGCARLLPTTRPYLLADAFPELLYETPVPCSREVWELSRFSTRTVQCDGMLTRDQAHARFRIVFAAAARAAMERGATRLITFTALGVERILRVVGVHAHRIGPPGVIGGKPSLPLWIELDAQTSNALDIPPPQRTLRPRLRRPAEYARSLALAMSDL
ncbi:MAG TPA: acyl-homoserine-lactone synthase [Rudaea sp.]